jgi:hypothetical protein
MNTKDHAVSGNVSTERALDLALEALERLDGWLALRYGSGLTPQEQQVVTAIKQARSAPVQEPVFCEFCGGNDDADFGLPTDHCTDCARPQPAAQRQWVGLTDEEIDHTEWIPKRGSHITYDIGWLDNMRIFARAIEAKLKERNV